MGKGLLRQKNNMKRQYLSQAVKYIDLLEKQNEALRTDPNTVLGQLIPHLRSLEESNAKLSVLVAAFVKAQGGSAVVTKEALDEYRNHRLTIHFTLPEGVTDVESATEFIVTFDALVDVNNMPPAEPQPEPDPITVTASPEVGTNTVSVSQSGVSTAGTVNITDPPQAITIPIE
jgi:hypothetical protein